MVSEIKTIRCTNPTEFDDAVNAALKAGFCLDRRGSTEGAKVFFAEMHREKADDAADNDVIFEGTLAKVFEKSADDEEDADDCCAQCEGCEKTDTKLAVESLYTAMKFMQHTCDRQAYCPDCPLYDICHCNLPFEWKFEK